MGHPGGAQDLPVPVLQPARIAQAPMRGRSARKREGTALCDARGHAFAPSVDTFRFRLLARQAGLAHISCGGDALGKRVALAVESAWIAQPARRTHLHHHFPARARTQLRARPRLLRIEIVVPGKLQRFSAQGFRLSGIVIDTESEARAPQLRLGEDRRCVLR